MADEVYKILQGRLRKHATDDGGAAAAAMADKLDCEGCRQANCQQLDDPYGSHSNRRKRPPSTSVPGGGEVRHPEKLRHLCQVCSKLIAEITQAERVLS